MSFGEVLASIDSLLLCLNAEHEREITVLQTALERQQKALTMNNIILRDEDHEEALTMNGITIVNGSTKEKESDKIANGGTSKWEIMTDVSGRLSRKTSSLATVEQLNEGSDIAFHIRPDWSKVPAASETFLDEVDAMLVEKNATAMVTLRDTSAEIKASQLPMKKSDALRKSMDDLNAFLPHRLLLIDPSSSKRIAWDLTGMCLISYDMVAIPIYLCFNPTDNMFTLTMGWITLIFWTCDMFASVMTGFYKHGDLVMDRIEIIIDYLKCWFWIDCIVVVPDWVMKGMGSMTNAAGLGRILRIARVFRVLRLLRLLKLKRLFAIVYDVIDSEGTFICFNLVKLLAMIVFMNHLVACLWYFVGKTSHDVGERPNWLQDVGMTKVYQEIDGVEYEATLTWKYLTSLHWSITQFTPASMDISATNARERFVSIVILFWALVALSSIIGSVSASMTALRNIAADDNKQIWIMRRYLKENSISASLCSRIMAYVEFQQVSRHNRVSPASVKLLSALSQQFTLEIAYEQFSIYLLEHPFFDHMTKDPTLLKSTHRLCCAALETIQIAEDEILFALGEEGRYMYFVKTGSLEYILLDGTPLETLLTPKLWASEAVLWTSWRHRGWLKATKPSVVLSLCPNKFSDVLHLHPKPWYLAMHYGVDFVNYLNKVEVSCLTDVIFDAEVWTTVVNESDTYVLKRKKGKNSSESSDGLSSRTSNGFHREVEQLEGVGDHEASV